MHRYRWFAGVAGLVAAGVVAAAEIDQWPHYGGALEGTRFAPGAIVTPANVTRLRPVWIYRSGDATVGDEAYFGRKSSFKATPILLDDMLVFSTGFNRVIALDARTGAERWRYDPEVDFTIQYSEMFTSRGVAGWRDEGAAPQDACSIRIFVGTLDARLIALDAADGSPCKAFGTAGEVDLSAGVANYRRGEYSMTSPPAVVNGVVVTGSSIGDNGGVELDAGIVRGWDARSGALLWSWDPIPRHAASPGSESWEGDSARRTGAANAWTAIAADAQRDLVFVPTTSPSPDFYGGERLGDNRHANSVVALRARTGELVWSYQVVRHDLWDYDLAAQPMLVDIQLDGRTRAALVQATKTGFVFVLDRDTGEPLHPVAERRVPASDVPGERAAKRQRFSSIALHPHGKELPAIWRHNNDHVQKCASMLEGVRFEGPFTPPSLAGTLLYPGNPGGVNWGSMAAHPQRQLAFVGVNRLPTVVRLIPRKAFRRLARTGTLKGVPAQYTAQAGTPYGMARFELYNPDNFLPCFEGPWSTLVAIDLRSAEILWEVPAGLAPGVAPGSEAAGWGFYLMGGPLATAGGVVFLATPFDRRLRAYDMRNGTELWSAELAAQPHATPMSYVLDGMQFVVVAAGGERAEGKGRGDYLVAFGLDGDDRGD